MSRAKIIHSDKYDYSLVEYIDSETKVKIICLQHGVFEQRPGSHLRGQGCSKCRDADYSMRYRLPAEEWKRRCHKVHHNKFDYSMVEYCGGGESVDIACPVHGVFKQSARNHLAGYGCKACQIDGFRGNIDGFIRKGRKVHGQKYDYSMVVYVDSRTKVKIKCNKCNRFFLQSPGNHLQGQGCWRCFRSKAEGKIALLLRNCGINFKEQYRFQKCRGTKYPLPFDFALFSKSGDLVCLIEYDGEQHYNPRFFGEEAFINTRKNDAIKTLYCEKNSIGLFRIKYVNFKKIDTIISNILKQCELI